MAAMKLTYYWLMVALYCVGMVLVGWLIRQRREKQHLSGEVPHFEFWMAQRQMPAWWLAASVTAGWLMLGWIGFGMSQIYMYGATGLWILPVPWLVLCFIIIAVAPLVRRLGAVSVPQALQQRFGGSLRAFAALCSFFVFISWTQAELFMAGTLMSPFLGVPPWVCMAVVVVPIMVYTYQGGFRANVTTDVVQFALMVVFMLVLAGVAVVGAHRAAPGGILKALAQTTPPWAAKGSVFDIGFLGWLFPVMLFVGYLPGWLIEQDLTVRLQSARSTRDARTAAWWGLVLIGVFVIVLPTIVAFCALVVYPPVNGAANPAVDAQAYSIVSAFCGTLPAWLVGFMIVGILACQMSTVDTFANVSAMPLAYDLIDPALKRLGVPWSARLGWARWVSVAVLGVALVLAMWSTSLQDVYYVSSGVLSASIAVPAFFIFWKRATLPAAFTASVAGFVTTVIGFLFEMKWLQADEKAMHYYKNVLPAWLHGSYGYNYIAAGVIVSALLLVVVSLLTPVSAPARLASVRPAPVDGYDEFLSTAFNGRKTGEPLPRSVR